MHLLQSKASHRAAVDQQAAQCLGWTSIAIGLTEILAPRRLEKTMGVGNGQTTGILRVLGVREIMHGVDILAHKDPTPGVWSRVFGDDMFTRFEENGIFDRETGARYRAAILERGGSVDGDELVRGFLGREPKMDAFLREIGLEA